jgi:hypothetical protein
MSESQSVRRWEYKTVRFKTAGFVGVKFDSDAFDAALNQFDSEGWELLSSYPIDTLGGCAPTAIVAILKRPRN